MPAEYRDRYTPSAVAAHERVCARRSGASVDACIFERQGSVTGICIVADDKPGLLSLISEAFAVSGLDVVAGDAFIRSVGGKQEAVDMFWVRAADFSGKPKAFGEVQLDKLRATLQSLSEGYSSERALSVGVAPTTHSNTTVRFIEDENGSLSTLEVETEDRAGLLLSLSRALHAEGVQILRSEVRSQNGRVFDRFVIAELDGRPVSAARRLEIQVSILSAAEPAKRLTSTPPPPALDDLLRERELA